MNNSVPSAVDFPIPASTFDQEAPPTPGWQLQMYAMVVSGVVFGLVVLCCVAAYMRRKWLRKQSKSANEPTVLPWVTQLETHANADYRK
ncbi:hypothetical protein HDU82_007607, partial [Entophlyctis luteolus]